MLFLRYARLTKGERKEHNADTVEAGNALSELCVTRGVMKKTFDCIAMKDAIQQRLLKRMEGLSYEQRRAAVRDVLEKSRSPIGDLWRKLEPRAKAGVARVAETGEAYGGERHESVKSKAQR